MMRLCSFCGHSLDEHELEVGTGKPYDYDVFTECLVDDCDCTFDVYDEMRKEPLDAIV